MLALALATSSRLRDVLPFLPAGAAASLPAKLARLIDEGTAYGVVAEGQLRSFLGALLIPGLRGAAIGGLSLEWAHASDQSGEAPHDMGHLYRELARDLVHRDCRLHSVSVFVTDDQVEAAFVQLGFGRFLANRASLLPEVLARLGSAPPPDGYTIVRATAGHAPDLARLHALLEAHLEASPVFLPEAEPWTPRQWERWLPGEDAMAFIAIHGGRPVGYIKAQEPQFDVTYAVHGDETLAINGMFVEPEHRGTGVARALLAAIAREGDGRDLRVLSVDHETANLEADGFWSRHFQPVSWALERRV
jgi:GNAT superfamily N-acetyltransferase